MRLIIEKKKFSKKPVKKKKENDDDDDDREKKNISRCKWMNIEKKKEKRNRQYGQKAVDGTLKKRKKCFWKKKMEK